MPNLAKINMKVAGSFARTCKSCSSQFTRTPSPMRHPQPPGFLEKFLVVRELLVCCFPEIHRGTVEHRGTTDKLLEENSTPNRHKKQHFPASSCADSHRHCGNAVLRYTLLEIMPVDHEIRMHTDSSIVRSAWDLARPEQRMGTGGILSRNAPKSEQPWIGHSCGTVCRSFWLCNFG